MPLKTSSCKHTLCRKNITRFAPLWGLYTLCLGLGFLLMGSEDLEFWFVYNTAGCIAFMSAVNLCYALAVTACLWGDLYNPRMCNALHALPVKRTVWFSVQYQSGLLFSLVPTALVALCAVPFANMSCVDGGWVIPLIWWLATNLQYLFFYGTATFCAQCAGNRTGLTVTYGILNFASMLAFLITDWLYVTLLPGVVAQISRFHIFCPAAHLSSLRFAVVERSRNSGIFLSDGTQALTGTLSLRSEDWLYLAVLAAIGLLLTFAACGLYRRRKLESAGDFAAVSALRPIYRIIIALAAASVFQIVDEFLGIGHLDQGAGCYIFAAVGLTVGWFAGSMLLERSTKVFTGKNLGGLALLLALAAVSLAVTKMDPLGISAYIPKEAQIASAKLDLSYSTSVTLDTPQEIADLREIHAIALEQDLNGRMEALNTAPIIVGNDDSDDRTAAFITLTYTLKTGAQVQREYYIWLDSRAGDLVRQHAGSLEAVLSRSGPSERVRSKEDLLKYAGSVDIVYLEGVSLPEEFFREEPMRELFTAIAADCEAGALVQHSAFHQGWILETEKARYRSYALHIMSGEDGFYLDIYPDSKNTLAWLEATGILPQVRESAKGFYS